jgi:hypothetical protein
MVFPRNDLASGPQACFLAEKRIAKVKVGKHSPDIDFSVVPNNIKENPSKCRPN